MRIWTIDPGYMDRQGLLALWREGLLAQKVLRGLTKGYRSHPQLERFRAHEDPLGAIGYYLSFVYEESVKRGYRFDRGRICSCGPVRNITETEGQLEYEWRHFLAKIRKRDRPLYEELKCLGRPDPHPIFRLVRGGIRSWERIRDEAP